jgi:iron complex outermembrane receptor protein
VNINRMAQFKAGSASVVLGFALLATPAFAQTTPADDAADDNTNDIVVTGSLIRNPNLTSSSPVAVIGDAEITRQAPTTTEEVLRGLPGVSPGIGSQVNNGSNGTNSVDLRGLGVQRNLVLLDGNRIVPTLANGVVDLNVIPLALVDRVDVLTGGASTTYGADAVSGVVNFITKRNFSGVDFRTSYRTTEQGDGQAFRGDLTIGGNFEDGRGNAVLSLSYTKAEPVYQIRDFALFGISSTSGRASGASATSVPAAIAFNDGSFLQVNPGGTALVPQYQGFNFNPYNIFQTPIDRKSLYAAVNYEVSDSVEFYARGLFVNNTIRSIIAPSGIFGNELTIPGNNPYLPATIRDQICTANGIALGATCNNNPALLLPAVYRRTVEIGPRVSNYENSNWDARAGAIFHLTDSLNLDVNGAYGRSEQVQTQSGYVLNSRVQQALNSTNTTTCNVTTSGCVPLNLFGGAGSISQAQANFLNGASTISINFELLQARALLSGDFGVNFPGAENPISFALGGEYRQYDYVRNPDARAQDPSELGGAGGATLPLVGGYDVKEVFGEVIVPIASGRSFFDELTVEGGFRYSSYAIQSAAGNSFDTWTYKGGLTWQPVEGLRLRGNYQRAVRAPNIGELFAAVVTGLTSLTTEPCVGAAPTTNANLAAICLAQGAPASRVTAGTIPAPVAGQANATGGGNVNLRPEESDSFTVGAIIRPASLVSNLTVSVDYYNIIINGAITSPTPGDVLNGCFGNITAASATSVACTSIRRNPVTGGLSGPTGTVAGLPVPLTNQGRLKTSGIDVAVDWSHDFGPVDLNVNFTGNWTRDLLFKANNASATSVNRDCVGLYSANCGPSLGQIQPEFSWRLRTTLGFGDIDISPLWRHISAVSREGGGLFSGVITNQGSATSALAGRTVNFNRIQAYDYFDLNVAFHVGDSMDFNLGVFNLFNRQPPVVGGQAGTTAANSGNTFPSTYDTLGRSFSASVRLKF